MSDGKKECWNCGNDCCCGSDLCQKCLDDSCSECGEVDGQCCCDECCECGFSNDDCRCADICDQCNILGCCCDDELDEENTADTFGPMNAFARARWLRAQQKGKNQ